MSSPGVSAPGAMRYTLDDVPKPFPLALGLGAQHVLTMFGATIAVPLLLGPAMGMDQEDIAILISSVMIASGVATFIQVRFGTRLPIIQGVSFSFLGPFFAIIAGTAGGAVTMQFIAGAILGGALVEMAVGYFGLLGLIRRFVSPVVIGPTIVLIGVFAFSLILAPKVRFFSLFPILLAVVVAYVIALILSWVGIIDEGSPGYIEFGALSASPWVRNPIDLFFPWGAPKFTLGFFLATLAGYMASMIESFGDYHAISVAAGAPRPSTKTISRGIGAEGIGCFFTSVFGGFASTSYTENIGLVALTRIASRYVVYVGAGVLVILGFVSKFGAVIATIPAPVVGGLYLTLFGLIASIGLSQAAKADLSSQRNQMIIGFCLFAGLSFPAYFGNPDLVVDISWADWLGDMIKTVGSTGMAVAALLWVIFDN